MLKKSQRVDKHLFEEVFSHGKNISGEKLYLKVLPKPTEKRISVVVPKKAAHGAVSRALMRRRGYAALRELWNQLPADHVYLLFFKPSTEGITYDEVRNEIEALLARLA